MRRLKKKPPAATTRRAMRADTAGEPLHLKLVQAIKQEIKNGRSPIGSLPPSEIELGRRHVRGASPFAGGRICSPPLGSGNNGRRIRGRPILMFMKWRRLNSFNATELNMKSAPASSSDPRQTGQKAWLC